MTVGRVSNWVDNISLFPKEVQHPVSLTELQAIFIRASEDDTTVKAIGSLHSASDVIDTDGILVRTEGLNKLLPLKVAALRPGRSPETLVHVECGIKIRDLIAALDHQGLALQNLGGYNGQSIIGAISTSTHGSGIRLGSLASTVESIILVTEGGATYQVEPANGITDPNKFDVPGVVLKQDDDWFYSTVVGMGCMGVVYSVTLRVRSRYWLEQSRILRRWDDVKANDFEVAVPAFRDPTLRHYEVLINPYDSGNGRLCLVTRRKELAAAPVISLPNVQAFFAALAGSIPEVASLIVHDFNHHPELTPPRIDTALKLLAANHSTGRSWDILLIGEANEVPAFASEIAVPADRTVEAVEAVLAIADDLRESADPILHTGPIALRFVAPSKHYLSPQYAGDDPNDPFRNGTCMIEFPCLVGTKGVDDLFLRYEEGLRPFQGRPHFGQWNLLRGRFARLAEIYPKAEAWRAVYKALNVSGTANNAFTRRCGFDLLP